MRWAIFAFVGTSNSSWIFLDLLTINKLLIKFSSISSFSDSMGLVSTVSTIVTCRMLGLSITCPASLSTVISPTKQLPLPSQLGQQYNHTVACFVEDHSKVCSSNTNWGCWSLYLYILFILLCNLSTSITEQFLVLL